MQSPHYLGRGITRLAAVLLLLLTAQSAYADSLMLAWDPSVDSSVAGYVVYVGVASGNYTQTFDVGNVTSFSYGAAQPGQRYYFSVAAYAAGPILGTASAEVSGVSNTAPTISNPGNQTAMVGQTVGLQLTASDPDGTPLTFSASGLPSGLLLTSGTGYVSGTPATAGTFPVTVTVSDGVLTNAASFTWTVNGQNATAPTLVSPNSTTTTPTPTFVWNAAQGAASYLVNVDDSVTASKVRMTLSAAATCSAAGVCSVAPGVSLAPGSAQWAVQTITSTGATLWSNPMSFAVPDLIAPTVAVSSPSGSTFETTQSIANLSGVASDNGSVASVSWANSRGGSGMAAGVANWAASVPLQPGINVLTLTARDAAGNASNTTMTAIEVVPPVPMSPVGSTTGSPTFIWQPAPAATQYVVSVTDGTGVEVIHTAVTPDQVGCAATPATSCTFAPGVALASGAAQWRVETIVMTDLSAWSSATGFTVDGTAPSLRITSPKAGNYSTNTGSITISGIASDNVQVASVYWRDSYGHSGVAQGTASWTIQNIALATGTTTFTVTAVDRAGNTTSQNLNVNYSTSPRGKKH